MSKALLVHDWTIPKDSIFSPSLRDNLSRPWISLKNLFDSSGIQLVTSQSLINTDIEFELHLNARPLTTTRRAFALLYESKYIYPPNNYKKLLEQYLLFFSWDSRMNCFPNCVPIFLGHHFSSCSIDGFGGRPILVSMIAANKSMPVFKPLSDLYLQRLLTISWFQRHAPSEFFLYGHGWDRFPNLPTLSGKALSRICNHFVSSHLFLKVWKGIAETKESVLRVSKFSIVYENVYGYDNYITKKIFDSFNSGCVPVYWGAKSIANLIPTNCFIDRRKFASHHLLYRYLETMQEDRYLMYQRAIAKFLSSGASSFFSPDYFSR